MSYCLTLGIIKNDRDAELMALPDVTPTIGYTETIAPDGRKVLIPTMASTSVGAIYQSAEDGSFIDRNGDCWMVGWLAGVRVRRRA